MNAPKYLPFLRYSIALLVVVSFWGCNPEDTPPSTGTGGDTAVWEQSTADVLCDLTNNVMVPIVDDFDVRIAELNTAILALNANHTAENLQAAQAAWRNARRPWEMCEAFLFGPAKSQQLDPAVDSWPLDLITIDSMLASSDQFTSEYFDQSEGTVKGSHAVEYLLWGNKGDMTVDRITPREYEFLVAVTESFRTATARLKKAWSPSADNYAKQLCEAGKPGSLYNSQKAGVSEIVNSLASILVEVSDAKMGIPFSQQTNEFEEARFSNNSIPDFLANVLGVQSVYEGNYGSHSGKGLGELVKAKNPALDTKIREQIQTAITRINAITPSFGEAITTNRNSIQTARFAISELSLSFSKDVAELLKLTN